jgi:hypothetical protein
VTSFSDAEQWPTFRDVCSESCPVPTSVYLEEDLLYFVPFSSVTGGVPRHFQLRHQPLPR